MISQARDRDPAHNHLVFPESDGKPMADNEINLDQMIDLILTLRQVLGPLGHHVGGNLLMYWNPLNPAECISPDVFVALDTGPERRRTWLVWEEGKFPEVVFEIASPSTRNRDIREKVALYDERGVQEYYIFDPLGRLRPAFRGYRRQGDALVLVTNPTGLSIMSEVLELELRVVGSWLRVIDPASGEPYPTAEEERTALGDEVRQALARLRLVEARLAQEERARHEEARARQAAEARASRLEADLAQLREALARLGGGEDRVQ